MSFSVTKLIAIIKNEIENLFPSYFAMTMATGIVSIGAYLMKISFVGEILFCFNIVAYIVLWTLLLCRLIFYFKIFLGDLSDHSCSAGFLSIVAGTNVLGSQFIIIQHNYQIAIFLYYLGLILWTVLIYSFFIMITVKRGKLSFEKGMNGIWLLCSW